MGRAKREIIQNKKPDSDSESEEEGEIKDIKSEFENHETSLEPDGYRAITSNPENELNLHTDGESDTKNQMRMKTKKIRRSNRKRKKLDIYGSLLLRKIVLR